LFPLVYFLPHSFPVPFTYSYFHHSCPLCRNGRRHDGSSKISQYNTLVNEIAKVFFLYPSDNRR
jgi:hypothetical protein